MALCLYRSYRNNHRYLFRFNVICLLLLVLSTIPRYEFQVNALQQASAMVIKRRPLPPWRGVRQILAIGPWGKVIDKVSFKANKFLLKATNTSQVLYVDNSGVTRLMDKADLPPKPSPQHTRIVAVSDTHGKHRFLPIPKNCDVLVHCGDVLQRYGYAGDLLGGLPALYDFRTWLRSVPVPTKLFCGGNHDVLLEELGDARVREIFERDDDNNIHYLKDNSVQINTKEGNQVTFYGSPWSPEGGTGNTAFQCGSEATEAVSELLCKSSSNIGIDVLMTHATCSTWEPILQSHNVKLWVNGHWHDGHGRTKVHALGECISVNVASNDMIYRPINPPVVIDVCV